MPSGTARAPRPDAVRIGCVTTIERYGGDLRCNPHYHGLFFDGVYVLASGRKPRFVTAPPPTAADVEGILEGIVAAARRLVPDEDALNDLAVGTTVPISDAGVQRFVPADAEPSIPRMTERAKARIEGFDLDAAVSVSRRKRDKLERLAR